MQMPLRLHPSSVVHMGVEMALNGRLRVEKNEKMCESIIFEMLPGFQNKLIQIFSDEPRRFSMLLTELNISTSIAAVL